MMQKAFSTHLAFVLILWGQLAYAEATDLADAFADAARRHRWGQTHEAIAIWTRLAEQGHVDAAYNLGLIYQYAGGVPYQPQEAARWYRLAAEAGDKAAQFRLGAMYLRGEGVRKDEHLAHEWFTRHRRAHLLHHHDARFTRWQEEAKRLIEARDRHEARVAALTDAEHTFARIRSSARAACARGNTRRSADESQESTRGLPSHPQ
ncbi:MAG: sel1 repeat family protein [Rhodocyclaceae bacterium]|nr:sel1 repeat family protein [Rhodocyclaceae bacterium]